MLGAAARMDEIDQFTSIFPKSKFDEQIASYAMLSLSQLKDNKRLNEYAEKVMALSKGIEETVARYAPAKS